MLGSSGVRSVSTARRVAAYAISVHTHSTIPYAAHHLHTLCQYRTLHSNIRYQYRASRSRSLTACQYCISRSSIRYGSTAQREGGAYPHSFAQSLVEHHTLGQYRTPRSKSVAACTRPVPDIA
eukprot:3083138-Rhodomonas_salina.1